jgi:hypothetical protein
MQDVQDESHAFAVAGPMAVKMGRGRNRVQKRLQLAPIRVHHPQAHFAFVDSRHEHFLAIGRPLQVLFETSVPGQANCACNGRASRLVDWKLEYQPNGQGNQGRKYPPHG